VIVPSLTAAFTALAVSMTGAIPVFADVDDDTLTMNPTACDASVTSRTRAIIPVHLYGQPASDDVLMVAARHSLAVIEDCCQAHLATSAGIPVGTRGVGGAFSFYPTKNLGALGDGGAVITNDAAVADRVRRLRNGGQTERYHHAEAGINSRLDEVQAAVLRARLPRLAAATAIRRRLAAAYRAQLPSTVRAVVAREAAGHVYHLFAVRSDARDALQVHLRAQGVETLIHYPVPLHAQPAFARSEVPSAAECPVATRACGELLSLPLHPRLTDADVSTVAEAIGAFRKGRVLA
jgi:dTDP-4-amino-4,6-dideoxygalactose transaminase